MAFEDTTSSSIYLEALWVLVLFAATACLREAIGELCTHNIAKSLLSCSHISGKTIDVFISCSGGSRSLGFGAAWRLWNIDKSGAVRKEIIILPMLCWLIGLPIKIVAVSAVRGGVSGLGFDGTWAVGITWVVFCFGVKGVAIVVDRIHGIKDTNGKLLSFRKVFQLRLCSIESYGMMTNSKDNYDSSQSYINPKPLKPSIGVDIKWSHSNEIDGRSEVQMKLSSKEGITDTTDNGLRDILKRNKIQIVDLDSI